MRLYGGTSRRMVAAVSTVAICAIGFVVYPAGSARAAGAVSTKTPPPKTGYTVGSVAPDLVMLTPGGKVIKLSQLRGRYVVLDLSTLWCDFSKTVADEMVPTLARLTAPGSLNAPVSWVTAEFDGVTPQVAPAPAQLANFAIEYQGVICAHR